MSINRRQFFKYSGMGLLGAVVLPFLPKIELPTEEIVEDEVVEEFTYEVDSGKWSGADDKVEFHDLSGADITRAALKEFHNNLTFLKTINKQYDKKRFGRFLTIK